MIYLDTHVVIWLYAGLAEQFSARARKLINQNELAISPIVSLEVQYLHEIGRITIASDAIISDLQERIGLQIDGASFATVVTQALALSWTRDPFDRMIVAQAQVGNAPLLTKDAAILSHFDAAVW